MAVTTDVVPDRPLLAPWYRLAEDGDRLLLEHGQSLVVLEGAAVRRLLPTLLPLLDGTLTVAEVYKRLGEPVRPAVEAALETLAHHGLLSEGPSAPPHLSATADAFAAAYELPPWLAAERLQGGGIGVVGGSGAAARIAGLLLAAGIGEVRRLGWEGPAGVDFAVVVPDPHEVGSSNTGTGVRSRAELRGCPCCRTTAGSRPSGR